MLSPEHNYLAPDTILQGRYRIMRRIGQGGMGAVYEALDSTISSLVAVKETFATTDYQREAFHREAKLLANLHHEAFPHVTHHFAEGDGQYLVMELIRGNDLWEMLRIREAPFPPEKVLEWADQLLDALQELHTCVPPIIHRDIKPPNIKLTARGKVKLLDFGIAKGSVGHMTLSTSDAHSVVGYTPHFAPLEQTLRSDRRWVETLEVLNAAAVVAIVNSPSDARSDLYSLGATLYHLVTNQLPSDATTRALAVWSGRPDPVASADLINPQVSPVVGAVLVQAMSLERQDRPANAAEMRQALRTAASLPSIVQPLTVLLHDQSPDQSLRRAESPQSPGNAGHHESSITRGRLNDENRPKAAQPPASSRVTRVVDVAHPTPLEHTVASKTLTAIPSNPSSGDDGYDSEAETPPPFVGWPQSNVGPSNWWSNRKLITVMAVGALLLSLWMAAGWLTREDSPPATQETRNDSGSTSSTPIVPPGSAPTSTPIIPPR